MSKFYEVRERDGAARLGELSLRNGKLLTPFMLDLERFSPPEEKESEEKGSAVKESVVKESAGKAEKANKAGEAGSVCGERRFSFEFGEMLIFSEGSEGSEENWEVPRGALLLPEEHPLAVRQKNLDVDFIVLAYASRILKSARDFASILISARESVPADVALWLPAVATPENFSLLAYCGVDIVDNALPLLEGYEGFYMLEEGKIRVSELRGELPCACEVCASLDFSAERLRELPVEERQRKVARHNSLLLAKEVRKVRSLIQRGELREYVEMKVRSSPFLTAVLRLLDANYDFFEKRTPVARRSVMRANTMESLRRVEVRRFAARVLERFEPPSRSVLLILPCSAKKPYSLSKSHRLFESAVASSGFQAHIHEIILTSPLGVVPRELEVAYPAAFYDVPVTGYWDAEERSWVSACLRSYLEKNAKKFNAIFAHFDGGSAYEEICREVADELGLEIQFTCEEGERAVSKDALNRLRSEIEDFCTAEGLEKRNLSATERALFVVKALADFQFGKGVGEKLVEGSVCVSGKYPQISLAEGSGGERCERCELARVVPAYGLLALSVSGARKLERILGDAYKVEIGDFPLKAKGAIFAGGVLNADPQIRVNDEVIFRNSTTLGVGRAKMSGWEMTEAKKGVAVRVRDVSTDS